MTSVESYQIPFVDPHIHLWDLGRLSYPWLTPPFSDDTVNGSTEAIAKTYLVEDYLAEARRFNVAGAVHVEAGAAPKDSVREIEWLAALNAPCGMPSAIVAAARLDDPAVETLLAQHARYGLVRGIRHIANWHPDRYYSYTPADLIVEPAWERGYALLARHRFSFDLQVYPGQLAAAAGIAERHPDIPVILNHCGMPLMREAHGKTEWRAGMKAFAAVAHASVKVSGFGIVDHAWTEAAIRPYVLEAIDLFGVDRCMFASNFPTDRLYADLDRVLGAYHGIVADFSEAERRALFGRNAARLYRLDLDI